MNLKYPMVIDGGLSNVLEEMGCDLNHTLWSAKIIEENPQAIIDTHLAYLRAGAQCIATSSYQATIKGFTENGYRKEKAKSLIETSVRLAHKAVEIFMEENPSANKPLVAGSIGPYGAYLADGSEYRGNYAVSDRELEDFHRSRMEIIASQKPDLFAFETFPDISEINVILKLTDDFSLPAWLSVSCKDDTQINDGSPIEQVTQIINSSKNIFAMGVNCTHPKHISGLIKRIKPLTLKKLLIYPNSGEYYDPLAKTWHGTSDVEQFVQLAEEWIDLGVEMIGGCCRIGPEHIRKLRAELIKG